jgi:Zn2+/Cd2+-exporting ATPase
LSERGKIVLATAALIGLGYLLKLYNGGVGETAVFLIACIVGTFGVAKHAFAAMRVGSFFNIEALTTIAVLGAIAIGEYEEAAIERMGDLERSGQLWRLLDVVAP